VALFGQGIRSEAHGDFKPARIVLLINRALAAAMRANAERTQITFVPQRIEVEGRATTPKVASQVKILSATISVEAQKPAPNRQ